MVTFDWSSKEYLVQGKKSLQWIIYAPMMMLWSSKRINTLLLIFHHGLTLPTKLAHNAISTVDGRNAIKPKKSFPFSIYSLTYTKTHLFSSFVHHKWIDENMQKSLNHDSPQEGMSFHAAVHVAGAYHRKREVRHCGKTLKNKRNK